jgi:alginate O-acetyltransferase complex protein AlgI
MVFSSPIFLFYFLPLFLVLYFATAYKNLVLLLFSLFFYAWGEGLYVLLLIASGFANYVFARKIAEAASKRRAQTMLVFGVVSNLAGLFFFKYLGFVVAFLDSALPGLQWPDPDVHLPIGISFFSFHAISYLVDVYRGEFPAERHPVNVLLYISMFPQLIAGPIVRFGTVRKEVHQREATVQKFAVGVKFFIIGLAQKVLIANTLAVPVDAVFKIPNESLTASLTWLGAVGYTLQIYFDFAGYSNMAIGLGLMVGLYFPLNFNYPYISQSITEFWRRWHITLSTWFRDYLYIPLGGNRKGSLRTYANLMLVFVLCGLWHGASWTFLAWGIYHGAFLVIERLGFGSFLARSAREVRHAYALLVVIFGWVLFRAESFPQAWHFVAAMVGAGTGDGRIYHVGLYLRTDVILALIIGAIAATPYLSHLGKRILDRAAKLHGHTSGVLPATSGWATVTALSCVFVLSIFAVAGGQYNPFIYFRF